jgi:hypothetical protein
MFTTETIKVGTHLPSSRQRFINLPAPWLEFKTGSPIVDLNYPEEVFTFLEWYDDRNGTRCVKAHDSTGLTRHLYGDSTRLCSLNGKHKKSKRGLTELSASEKRLSRTEKRKLRRERREPARQELAGDVL